MYQKNESEIRKSIFCAIDTSDLERAVSLASDLKGIIGGIKLGKEFFTEHGPQGVKTVANTGMPIFLDLKYHDIPNTVSGAVRSAVRLNPFMINVHASGGEAMMISAKKAAKEEAERLEIERPLVIAVTILTSLTAVDLKKKGNRHPTVAETVKILAKQAKQCGLDGVVCSGEEIDIIRSECGSDFKLVVPGLRPPWVKDDDQKRTMSPCEATQKGADFLVIGRPITNAEVAESGERFTPAEASQKIVNDILEGKHTLSRMRA